MYTVIDVETTGGAAHNNKIIEIAVIKFDGKEIVDEFHSLVNPGLYIPSFITALTGISTEMVEGAPFFKDIAERILQITDDQIFVAHNVNFDYGFIKKEFDELGLPFNRRKLCTVRLSKKILPGFSSYSLGTLSACLGIKIEGRHRAYGDAEATVNILRILLEKDSNNFIDSSLKRNSMEATLPPNLTKEVFNNLPEKTGVYYFHNKKGTVIYVGKAKNIKKRILGHFTGESSKEKRLFFENLYDISFELTGSELVALLEESKEIKRLWPEYNRIQKLTSRNFGLFLYKDQNGYLRMNLSKVVKGMKPEMSFRSFQEGRVFLNDLVNEFRLCPKLCGLQKSSGACFNHSMNACDGACIGEEEPEVYNEKVGKALEGESKGNKSMAIIGRGRVHSERSIVLIERGTYLGYGYVDADQQLLTFDEMKDCIRFYQDNQDVQKIIALYLNQPNGDQVIEF